MKRVVETERLPIKMWLDDFEDGAFEQAKNIANLPVAVEHVAIMPDSHQGYGMPIGGVLATDRAIIPNAVGVDIGCGMCSLRTDLRKIGTDKLKKIMGTIRKTVPVGFNHHNKEQEEKWMPEPKENLPIVKQEYKNALKQVGTLGGGNHFIEIQAGSDGYIWIMIHSGSRNIGYTVAGHYNKLAAKKNEESGDEIPNDLAFFREGTPEFDNYINEMNYCIEFALANRKLMMERVKVAMTELYPDVQFSDFINKPHNFASREHHFGRDVIVHRKGATRAREGEPGMIPGSQGSSSFIVRGKGNKPSFESCSHGAGRTMSRNQAKKTLTVEGESRPLEERGILHAIRHKSDLDEAPGSYKKIEEVMENQTDLIDVVIELNPLGVIKG